MEKIFCIGSNKTGTTSLSKALSVLKYRVCPETIFHEKESKLFLEIENNNFENIFKIIERFDAFQDRPWNHNNFYQKLNIHFPNSKFILTLRDSNKWVQSYRIWSKRANLINKWYYKSISNICYGNDDFLSDEKGMVEIYEKRNNEIIEYFKDTNKLLILDLDKNFNWNILCSFLNKKIPKGEFPHMNRTS